MAAIEPDWSFGAQVRIFGLKSAVQHNGTVGRLSSQTGDNGRLGVLLDSGELLSLRRENLKLLRPIEWDSDFGTVTKRALEVGMLNDRLLDNLTDSIAEGRRTEAEVTAELRERLDEYECLRESGPLTTGMRAAATAASLSEQRAADLRDHTQAMGGLGLNVMEMMMQAAGVEPPERDWLPSELGCCESNWEGLPARDLFLALKNRRTDELRRLIITDASLAARVNDVDGDGFGLLHNIAYHNGEVDAIDTLVEFGAEVNLRNRFQESPLHLAVMYERVAIADRLLTHGARADLSDWHGTTTLMRAKELKQGPSRTRLISLVEAAVVDQRATVPESEGIFSSLTPRAAEADEHRKMGNGAYAAGRYQEAIDAYTRSVDVAEDARTFANRAACWLKLGLARYRERRITHGLLHQVCDGEAKILRWVPTADGTASSPTSAPEGFEAADGGVDGSYYPFCDGSCSKREACAFRCRSVEPVTKTIGDLYRQAVCDAGRARTLDPTNAKAFYRQAKANVGLRDFPRARLCLKEGLHSCPGNESMLKLRDELVALGVRESVSNPLSPIGATAHSKGDAAMRSGEAYILCAYCTGTIAGRRPRLADLGHNAYEGRLTKVEALAAAGFPSSCPYCTCDPRADIDQRKIRSLIEAP